MTIPYDEWQFWLVTVAMLWGVFIIVRPFFPKPNGANGGNCPNCAMGSAAQHKTRPAKTKLTVGRNK